MKVKTLFLCITAALGAAAVGLALPQESKDAGKAPSQAEQDAMMKEMMALAEPGAQHKKLQEMAGNWDATIKMWMGGPGSPPMESKGTSTGKMILDGRFLREEFDGTMMGLPFKGEGTTGYDKFRNVFVGTWMDSMGTGIITNTGSMDPSGKELNSYGTMDEPSMKLIGRMVRYRTVLVDHDKHVFEMYDLHAGPEYKVMEITYTRKK